MALAGQGADALGRPGWRAPLRSTALRVLRDSIHADPGPWAALGGAPPRGLEATLAALPATRQERFFARLYFALSLAIAVLSAFRIATAVVTLARPAAAAVLTHSALSAATIWPSVIGGALIDLALGLRILWRPACRAAALGMIAVSAACLIGATLVVPALWADPLGPLVKVVPGMALALIVWLWVEPR